MESIYNFSNEEKEKIAYLKKLFTQDFIKWDKKQFKITKNKKSVLLYTPKSISEDTINAYLLKNEYVIYKKVYKHIYLPLLSYKIPADKILYLGKYYSFILKPEINNTYKIDNENRIIYAGKNLLNKINMLKFYKEQAAFIIPARVYMYAKKLNIEINKVDIKLKRWGMWGCCYSTYKKIFLNEMFILSPVETIDSVINHELAHILHPNHSKDFYKFLEEIYPDYYKDHLWLCTSMPLEYPPEKEE